MLPERAIRIGHDGRARVEAERWSFVAADAAEPLPGGALLVPLATWARQREALLARHTPVGVWLAPGDDPATIAADLPSLALVAVHFPKFTDGRGYSTATLLRTRLHYRGELRAFGDIGRDQLHYLRRCGFDSFSLAPRHEPEGALAGLEVFSIHYQGAVDDPVPLFRRRLDAAGPR